MIIYSFDCAVKNLGVCCISVDEHWRDKISAHVTDLYKLYEMEGTRKEFLDRTQAIMRGIDSTLDNMYKLVWINVFDLIPGQKLTSVPFGQIVAKLKYIMWYLGKTLPEPDVVLIEYQMNANDKARGISRFIEEYYTPLKELESDVSIGIDAYPLNTDTDLPDTRNVEVCIINPTLKNAYQVDKSDAGNYSTFIQKYSNYVANKKHTTHNFKHYMSMIGKESELVGLANKLDDVSDAFMMAYAWCKKRKLIE
jgi:hypothetical protein